MITVLGYFRFLLLFGFLNFLTNSVFAQYNYSQQFFLQNNLCNPIDEYYIKHEDDKFHSSFKPYLYSTLQRLDDQDIKYRHFSAHVYNFRKEFFDSTEHKNKITWQVLPQIDFQQSYDALGKKMLNETSGGVYTKVTLNQKFSFDAQLISGYVNFPNFTDTLVAKFHVIPGLGRAYKQSESSKTNGLTYSNYSFTNFTGTVSYSPASYLNFQLAKGKMFIGDGYRSLLLSDVANNYPYFKTSLNIWKLQYNCWYSWFYDIYNTNELNVSNKNKFGTFHYLSWNATKKLNISVFENIVWAGTDTTRSRGFDPSYLNPVIFLRPVEFSGGSSDNAMLGLNWSLKLWKKVKLYGQLVVDEFLLKEVKARKGWWANKQGFQVGMKYIDAFGMNKLSLQTELNYVRPYTYSHGDSQQNYAHYNEALAHPFGANFYELVGIAAYKHHRYRLELKGNYAVIGKDTSWSATSNVGQNIFLSYNTHNKEYSNYLAQGVRTTFMQMELKYTFYLIPNVNLRIEAGYIQRSVKNEFGFKYEVPFVYLGVKTSLYNFYRDLL